MTKPNGIQTVLVTGGAGYIGSVLVELLLEYGYEVVVLDRFFFGSTLSDLEGHGRLRLVKGDVRWFPPELLAGIDAVCDLAALSNDPVGELDPNKTMEINFAGRARVAKLAKERSVKRYILASSCSIYGYQDGILDETSAPNPLTTYARANREAEETVLPFGDTTFSVTALRQATVYGPSRRMRFDLAINGMILGLFKSGKIPILRDGNQWRPMVHVRDTTRAFLRVLEAEPSLVQGEIFNVGSDEQNFQILPLARRLAEAVDVPFEFEWYGLPDHRSYRVSFNKIKQRLGYQTRFKPEDAAKEIYVALKNGKLAESAIHHTVEWYKSLIQWRKIIDEVTLNDVVI